MKTLFLSLSLSLALTSGACDVAPPLATACPAGTQWSPCFLGSTEAACWVGGTCANGDESLCGNPDHPMAPLGVDTCAPREGLTCVTECESP